MKKNLLITHVHLETGGIEVSLINLLNSLDKEKYNIDLILFYPKGELLVQIPKWVNIIPIYDTVKMGNKLLQKVIMSRNILMRVIKNIICNSLFAKYFVPKKHYDAAIAYSGYSNFIDKIAGISDSDKKLIWAHADFYTQCKIDKAFEKKFEKIYCKYKLFDKIVCVSESVLNNLKSFRPNLTPKLTYLWNINKKRQANIENECIKLNKNTFNIITMARLEKYKGLETLIEVGNMLNRQNFDFNITILGSGSKRQVLEEKIEYYKLQSKIKLLGNVCNVFNVLEQADLYVSPSECESFSNVTLEAFICGIPVVATPTAGNVDIFNHIAINDTMLLSRGFSAEDITASITEAKCGLIKGFSFDIEALNNDIVNKFEQLINN